MDHFPGSWIIFVNHGSFSPHLSFPLLLTFWLHFLSILVFCDNFFLYSGYIYEHFFYFFQIIFNTFFPYTGMFLKLYFCFLASLWFFFFQYQLHVFFFIFFDMVDSSYLPTPHYQSLEKIKKISFAYSLVNANIFLKIKVTTFLNIYFFSSVSLKWRVILWKLL